MPFDVDVLFHGFSGKLTTGGLGWGTVALIRNNQRNILLDTGGPVVRAQLRGLLKRHGLDTADIDIVLLTHLHFDHAGNVDYFPHAEFVFSAIEWNYINSIESRDCYAAESALPLLRTYRTRLVHNDNEEIVPGIFGIFTPGHTPGSLSYVIHNDNERWVMSGDAAKNRGELRSGKAQMTLDKEASSASIKKILSCGATRVLPGHDGWVTVGQNGEIIAEGGNDITFVFDQAVTVNGGQTLLKISMD